MAASPKEEVVIDGNADAAVYDHDLNGVVAVRNSNMNEIVVNALGRHDPNTYECVARNAVPPATSRIFYFEIQCM